MTQLTAQILLLTSDQKVQLIHALTEQISYPSAHKPLGFHVDHLPAPLEPQIATMSPEQKKALIRTIVNHI